MKNKIRKNQGSVLIYIVIVASIGAVVLLGLITFVVSQDRASRQTRAREQAFGLAEQGIYWYRWYLAHMVEGKTAQEVSEFWESGNPVGVGTSAVYTVDGIGKYTLEVEKPDDSSSIVKVKSTGWTDKYPSIKRVIEVRFRKQAWCEYAVLSKSDIRFGQGTDIYGLVHANGGVQFDGVAHHLVTSSVEDYNSNDDDVRGEHPGVWTNNPPESERFLAGYSFPVPVKDFDAVVADLNMTKDYSGGVAGGLYLGQDKADTEVCDWVLQGKKLVWKCETINKKVRGYHLVFHPQSGGGNDTISVSMVVEYGFSSFKIEQETAPINYTVPTNGLIFVENNAWVEGQIEDERLTVVAADLSEATADPEPPGHDKNIFINSDILYTNKDGSDILGLLAQNDVSIGLYSEDDLEIDAAVLARRGRVGRDQYDSPPEYFQRSKITIYGSVVTNERYMFNWLDAGGSSISGYDTREIIFDNNLLYYPPPFFPTGDKYQIDLWREI